MEKSEKEIAIEKAIEILNSHEIELDIFGCGCCHSPIVTMKYKGKIVIDDVGECNIDNIKK